MFDQIYVKIIIFENFVKQISSELLNFFSNRENTSKSGAYLIVKLFLILWRLILHFIFFPMIMLFLKKDIQLDTNLPLIEMHQLHHEDEPACLLHQQRCRFQPLVQTNSYGQPPKPFIPIWFVIKFVGVDDGGGEKSSTTAIKLWSLALVLAGAEGGRTAHSAQLTSYWLQFTRL